MVGKSILGKRFKGVFDEKDLDSVKNSLKSGEGALINLPSGVHWISLLKIGGKIHSFDSYNRPVIDGVKMTNEDKVPKQFEQKGDEKTCGPRALAYLADRLLF